MTDDIPPWYHINVLLDELDDGRRLEWWIWGAKENSCPECGQPPNQPCVHLGEKAKGRVHYNKWPHSDRVDFNKIETELRRRLDEV